MELCPIIAKAIAKALRVTSRVSNNPKERLDRLKLELKRKIYHSYMVKLSKRCCSEVFIIFLCSRVVLTRVYTYMINSAKLSPILAIEALTHDATVQRC